MLLSEATKGLQANREDQQFHRLLQLDYPQSSVDVNSQNSQKSSNSQRIWGKEVSHPEDAQIEKNYIKLHYSKYTILLNSCTH